MATGMIVITAVTTNSCSVMICCSKDRMRTGVCAPPTSVRMIAATLTASTTRNVPVVGNRNVASSRNENSTNGSAIIE